MDRQEKKTVRTVLNLCFNAIRHTAFQEIVSQNKTKSCAPVFIKRKFIYNPGGNWNDLALYGLQLVFHELMWAL